MKLMKTIPTPLRIVLLHIGISKEVDSGNDNSVQSYTTSSIMAQRGVGLRFAQHCRLPHSILTTWIIDQCERTTAFRSLTFPPLISRMDNQIRLLELQSTRQENETKVVDYASTFPQYSF